MHAILASIIGGWDDWPKNWECGQIMVLLQYRHSISFTFICSVLHLFLCHSYWPSMHDICGTLNNMMFDCSTL